MESYIQISKINDFIFCPQSIYLHAIYEKFHQKVYHETPQTEGKIVHEKIEDGSYSTSAHILQGTSVYCEKYGLAGKIDIYDSKNQHLIERKNKVSVIYDGYRYQLYAQMFAMEEMGHPVKQLYIHSLTDNKRYTIDKPDEMELKKFEATVGAIRSYNIETDSSQRDENKCAHCIYRPLCHP